MSENEPDEKRRPGYVYDPAAPLPEHLVPKKEVPYKSKYREGDSAEKAFRLKAFTWSLPGGFIGLLIGGFTAAKTGNAMYAWLIPLGMLAFSYFGALWLADMGGRTGASLYFASGSSTPSKRQYSLGDSLVARAKFDEAAREYERGATEFGDDPEPALRLARLHRDHLHEYDHAIRWFRTAVGRKGCDGPTEMGALRELIEVYTHRMREPARALPDLARLVDRHGTTTTGAWARRQIAEIKQDMQHERG